MVRATLIIPYPNPIPTLKSTEHTVPSSVAWQLAKSPGEEDSPKQ